jgi:CheY-like chemotaxis protein
MAAPTLLCIHRDPARLKVLHENGYQLLTAVNGCEGLRLFQSQPVDAIVLEYNLGLLDGAVVASEIKQVQPKIPVVMLAEHAELPEGALQSVDVLVSTSDPPHFLWAAVHFLLTVQPAERRQAMLKVQNPEHLRRPGRPRDEVGGGPGGVFPPPAGGPASMDDLRIDERDAPFSPYQWQIIRDGTVQF